MFNVLNKTAAVILVMCAVTSCADKKEETARVLLAQAQTMYEQGNYSGAVAMLDSLDSSCKEQVEIRRDAMHLRPQIIEKQSLIELQSADSLIAVLSLESEKFRESLKKVDDGFEGYYTTNDLAGLIPADREGLYARMSPDGVLTLISSARKGTESTAVKLSVGAEEAVSAVVEDDGERNDRSRGQEIIIFMPDETKEVCEFIAGHYPVQITLTFLGKKGYSTNLDEKQAEAIVRLYSAAEIFSRLRSVNLDKTRLEKQIDIARSQIARTYREKL